MAAKMDASMDVREVGERVALMGSMSAGWKEPWSDDERAAKKVVGMARCSASRSEPQPFGELDDELAELKVKKWVSQKEHSMEGR